MRSNSGFTLIELSIVLVIIGLIVGGVLVGQDLIRAAEVRATLTQIQKYNTAVNTFYGKYAAIPGDMNLATAQTFGFITTNRGTSAMGDGNGLLIGGSPPNGGIPYILQCLGETGMFWVDISSSVAGGLIDGGFTSATYVSGPAATSSGTSLVLCFPAAKLGRGNMFYVYEQQGRNFYGMSNVTSLSGGSMTSTAGISPLIAYQIDNKMDDGIANSGSVIAAYVGGNGVQSAGITADPYPTASYWSGSAASGSYTATTCFDSGSGLYVTQYNNGQGVSCGLSFRFQ